MTGGVPFVFNAKQSGEGSEDVSPTLLAMPHDASHANAGGQLAVCVTGNVPHTLTSAGHDASEDGTGRGTPVVVSPGAFAANMIRRLTPIECERLMGWPDNWTAFRADGSPIADGPRYRLCGNGVVATISEWLAKRIMRVMLEGKSS